MNEAPDLDGLPEFALVGRSNVGKSSFINCLLGRKNLARTSNTPGKTRALNFYLVNDSFALVDLPGYGYAKTSKSNRKLWRENFERFLTERETLRHVFCLIDSRHGPQANDLKMLDWLEENELTYTIVLTKLDKVKKSEVKSKVAGSADTLGLPVESLLLFSSETSLGREVALGLLSDLMEP